MFFEEIMSKMLYSGNLITISIFFVTQIFKSVYNCVGFVVCEEESSMAELVNTLVVCPKGPHFKS
jgi:hypothetical protein